MEQVQVLAVRVVKGFKVYPSLQTHSVAFYKVAGGLVNPNGQFPKVIQINGEV